MTRLLSLLASITAAILLALGVTTLDSEPSRPRFIRCDWCKERDAFVHCATCGLAWCDECEPAHVVHSVEV